MHLDQLTVIYFVALVAAIILHEISHGVVALWLGDDTARRAGRLTLNPIPHIDPFGSIILPALGALAGIPVVGWAKPVPINPSRLRNGRRDMVLVSLAGPATNLLLMLGSAFVARALYHPTFGTFTIAQLPLAVQIALAFAIVNLFLGLFNLVPIPPLDGAALLERVLPREWLPGWQRFRPYGMLVIFALVFWGGSGLIGHLFDPFLRRLESYALR
ncbi:MAG: site-2 protease family protein [Acidimicrobiia bacterium]